MKRSMFLVAVLAIFAIFCVSCAGGNYRAKRPCSPCPATTTVTVYPPVTVDYSRNLGEMIAAGKYSTVSTIIDSAHFPLPTEVKGKRDVIPKVVYFGEEMMADDVLNELDRLGLQPAKIEVLLAFGEKYAEEYTEYPLVALGSLGFYPYGGGSVPVILWDVTAPNASAAHGATIPRTLGPYPFAFERPWPKYARFLAVDKE